MWQGHRTLCEESNRGFVGHPLVRKKLIITPYIGNLNIQSYLHGFENEALFENI